MGNMLENDESAVVINAQGDHIGLLTTKCEEGALGALIAFAIAELFNSGNTEFLRLLDIKIQEIMGVIEDRRKLS